jgi:N-acetylglucosamine-6-sulfatase
VAPERGARGTRNQPNVVLVQTDDQSLTQFNRRSMPKISKLLGDEGTRFPHAYLTTPDCCPSRASLITGEYGHNNGVLHNAYSLLRHKTNVLPVWLQRAGYVTAHIGKFLNGYRHLEPAPGWTQWHTTLENGHYYDYDLSVNGKRMHHGERPRDYVTRVFGRAAIHMIDRYVPGRRPLYLQLDEVAPHVAKGGRNVTSACSPVPDPRDEGKFKATPLPHPPSFDERDMSDKPAFMRGIPRISRDDIHRMKRNYGCGLASLRSVDRSVERIYDEIKRLGELNNTVFVFYTDNGIFYGEHRLPFGKLNPYNEALSTPLVMRVPRHYLGGKKAVGHVSAPVANIDLAPTILRLAHVKPCKKPGNCRIMDGRSLLPLIAGRNPRWAPDRPIGMEINTEHGSAKHLAACEYSGVRVGEETFVKYRRVQKLGSNKCIADHEFESYDLAKDPYQLHNLCFGGDPRSCPNDSDQRDLRKLVKKIRRCAGIAGRDPRTGDRPYCD